MSEPGTFGRSSSGIGPGGPVTSAGSPGPGLSTGPGAGYDPLQASFATGQQLYKAGLISLINSRRFARGLLPVPWPAVGTTPIDVMWAEGPARLVRYRPLPRPHDATASKNPPTTTSPAPPLLLVCSLINRPYVLDLLEERSVVRRLLGAGIDVWLLDWGTPDETSPARGLGYYALDLLPRAAAGVSAATRAEAVHVLGYCMGGTFALMAAAADRLPPGGLVTLATPVDFDDGGMLSIWCRTPGMDPRELARAFGIIPPYILQPAFKMLDPLGLAAKFVHLDGKLADDEFLRFFLSMETWLEDSVGFPGRAFAEWIEAYQTNALARGQMVVDGVRIDLGRVDRPVLNIVAEADYITPTRSSLALEGLLGHRERDYELVRMAGGHIGLSTGGAAHRELWPRVAAWLHAHSHPQQHSTPHPHSQPHSQARSEPHAPAPAQAKAQGPVGAAASHAMKRSHKKRSGGKPS